jgi:hypothetical protein
MATQYEKALQVVENPSEYHEKDVWKADAIVSAVDEALQNRWIRVRDGLPKHLETVWITNGKGWTTLGCLIVSDGGWHWAESNGTAYQENGKIVAECESEDLDVEYWQALPDCIMK